MCSVRNGGKRSSSLITVNGLLQQGSAQGRTIEPPLRHFPVGGHLLASRTGVIFCVERRQARVEREARDTREGRSGKKYARTHSIVLACGTGVMLLRDSRLA